MKLLILGGSGLIGNALIKNHRKDFEIISSFNKNPISFSEIKAFQCSLPRDFNKLEEMILVEKPDIIVNAMGYSNVDFCELNQQKADLLHVKITEKICNLCTRVGVKVIFLSSDYVFDGKKGNYSEIDEPNPINYYGVTKLKAEKIVLKNPTNVVLRTSIVYDLDNKVRFFNYVIDNLQKNQEITAINDVYNSATFIDNLTQSIFKVIKLNKNGIFHIVDSTCINRFEFAGAIAEVFQLNKNLIKSISVHETETVAKRPKNTCLDNSKAKAELGVDFKNIKEGLNQIFKKSQS